MLTRRRRRQMSRSSSILEIIDFLPLFTIIIYLFSCPYTKVEESFNVQAIHDLLSYGIFHLSQYDHLQFPGVVSRTFLGPLCITCLTYPMDFLLKLLFSMSLTGLTRQIIIRLVLGGIGWIALVTFRKAISKRFNSRIGQLFMIIISLQFHFSFYLSRTLPNTFALILSMLAYARWLDGRALQALVILAIATIVFRCDLIILIGVMTIQMLYTGEITFLPSLLVGILVGVITLTVTISVDSYFWRRWLWPEGEVLFFNTIENRSSEWGVMAWHWYFTSALPKALTTNLLWIICAFIGIRFDSNIPSTSSLFSWLPLSFRRPNMSILYYGSAVLMFISIYSILPHKELRFIFPALPMLSLVAAVGLGNLLPGRSEILFYPLSLLDDDDELIIQQHSTHKKKDDDYDHDDKDKDSKSTTEKSVVEGRHAVYGFLVSLGVILIMTIAMFLASIFLSSSAHNYPGGVAIDRLLNQHLPLQLADTLNGSGSGSANRISQPIFIHIDVPAAMTGVTRFTQERIVLPTTSNEKCFQPSGYLNLDPENYSLSTACAEDLLIYSKNETRKDLRSFDWIITADPSRHESVGFRIAETVYAFKRLQWSKTGPHVVLAPSLYIMVHEDD